MNHKKRILHVDDEIDVLYLCQMFLEKNGYEVDTLTSCENLLEKVKSFAPDLILMDHHMPHICGDEAIRLLKTESYSKNIPVIYFTAHVDREELAIKIGADAHLPKPFKLTAMIETVKRLIA